MNLHSAGCRAWVTVQGPAEKFFVLMDGCGAS